MSKRRQNTQLFALPAPPTEEITIAGATYRLVRVFKHDSYAATTLYQAVGATGVPPAHKIVVKFYRTQPFCGLPMAWLGRLSRDHEQAIYAALAGVQGVPRWGGTVGQTGFALGYIDARTLHHCDPVPSGYFDRMRKIFDAVHARGVAYMDADKRSNMLVGAGGEAFLIDFQIAIRRRDDWPWPLRAIAARLVRYVQEKDLYHLYKHKRRLAPAELTQEEQRLSRRRAGWHWLHRKITKPYRAVRRWFLHRQYRSGRLVSPTHALEDRHQPEADSWRNP